MALDISEYVVRAVARKAGVSAEQITGESRLFQDLGLGGDDAAELLTEVAKACQVDTSSFAFEDYFPPEPTLRSVMFRKASSGSKKELTVAALIRATQNGRLAG